MIPPFVVKMIVSKVITKLIEKIKLDKIEDYVFKDNNLDKQVKILRDELDEVKVKLINMECNCKCSK